MPRDSVFKFELTTVQILPHGLEEETTKAWRAQPRLSDVHCIECEPVDSKVKVAETLKSSDTQHGFSLFH